MNNLSQKEIIHCLQKWEKVRWDADQLNGYFSKGYTFTLNQCFEQDLPVDLMLPIHAYPGIYYDQLAFFLIPSWQDVPDNATWEKDVVMAIVTNGNEGNSGEKHMISEPVAQKRIETWLNYREPWTILQIGTTLGVYQAFLVPGFDLSAGLPTGYLALNENYDSHGFTADLIIDGPPHENDYFYDTVRPVPPFKPYTKKGFYLLELAGV